MVINHLRPSWDDPPSIPYRSLTGTAPEKLPLAPIGSRIGTFQPPFLGGELLNFGGVEHQGIVGCTPGPTYPYGKSLYKPYIRVMGIYGL